MVGLFGLFFHLFILLRGTEVMTFLSLLSEPHRKLIVALSNSVPLGVYIFIIDRYERRSLIALWRETIELNRVASGNPRESLFLSPVFKFTQASAALFILTHGFVRSRVFGFFPFLFHHPDE